MHDPASWFRKTWFTRRPVRELKNAHNSVTVRNRTHVYMNFFHHKDLGNHLLQLCPKVVKHPVYIYITPWIIPEERRPQLHCGGSVISCKYIKIVLLAHGSKLPTIFLKPTGHVMHHQFNIQQLYALPTLYLCVLYLSENKQRLVPLTAQTAWFL